MNPASTKKLVLQESPSKQKQIKATSPTKLVPADAIDSSKVNKQAAGNVQKDPKENVFDSASAAAAAKAKAKLKFPHFPSTHPLNKVDRPGNWLLDISLNKIYNEFGDLSVQNCWDGEIVSALLTIYSSCHQRFMSPTDKLVSPVTRKIQARKLHAGAKNLTPLFAASLQSKADDSPPKDERKEKKGGKKAEVRDQSAQMQENKDCLEKQMAKANLH
ncbi:hypothetical protein BKA69DRAFT_747490 [Paraphysoderma sedebokerense]|nr:hypothetical protein BKA69DRAFT_747490 [Paraphysoderma sedebokerense]